MARFAARTKVPVSKSRAEIESLLVSYGATCFATGWNENGAVVSFQLKNLHIRIELSNKLKSDMQAWRLLLLLVRSKLEAVTTGISTFEEEFLAHTVVQDGSGETVGQLMMQGKLQLLLSTRPDSPPLLS